MFTKSYQRPAIFDTCEDGDLSYAVTELLEGETLRARLQRGALA